MAKRERKQGPGRPRTLETEEGKAKAERFLQALRGGNFRETALKWAGIPDRSFRVWMAEAEAGSPQSSVDFAAKVIEAENAAEIRNVGLVMKAAEDDPKHAKWWLERKCHERWGRKDRIDAKIEGPGEDGAILHEHKGLGIAELFADPRARELACELEEAIASGLADGEDDTGGTGEGSDGG